MGSLELQIFVSLFVILGAAFVALLCDFLKGNNERLRERNVELQTRHEERDKREHLLEQAQRQAWNVAVQAQESAATQLAAQSEAASEAEAAAVRRAEEVTAAALRRAEEAEAEAAAVRRAVEEAARVAAEAPAEPVTEVRIPPDLNAKLGPVDDQGSYAEPALAVAGPILPEPPERAMPRAEAPPVAARKLKEEGPEYPSPMPPEVVTGAEAVLVFDPQRVAMPSPLRPESTWSLRESEQRGVDADAVKGGAGSRLSGALTPLPSYLPGWFPEVVRNLMVRALPMAGTVACDPLAVHSSATPRYWTLVARWPLGRRGMPRLARIDSPEIRAGETQTVELPGIRQWQSSTFRSVAIDPILQGNADPALPEVHRVLAHGLCADKVEVATPAVRGPRLASTQFALTTTAIGIGSRAPLNPESELLIEFAFGRAQRKPGVDPGEASIQELSLEALAPSARKFEPVRVVVGVAGPEMPGHSVILPAEVPMPAKVAMPQVPAAAQRRVDSAAASVPSRLDEICMPRLVAVLPFGFSESAAVLGIQGPNVASMAPRLASGTPGFVPFGDAPAVRHALKMRPWTLRAGTVLAIGLPEAQTQTGKTLEIAALALPFAAGDPAGPSFQFALPSVGIAGIAGLAALKLAPALAIAPEIRVSAGPAPDPAATECSTTLMPVRADVALEAPRVAAPPSERLSQPLPSQPRTSSFHPFAPLVAAAAESDSLALPAAGFELDAESSMEEMPVETDVNSVVRIRVLRDEDLRPIGGLAPMSPSGPMFFGSNQRRMEFKEEGPAMEEAPLMLEESCVIEGGFAYDPVALQRPPKKGAPVVVMPAFDDLRTLFYPPTPNLDRQLDPEKNLVRITEGRRDGREVLPAGLNAADVFEKALRRAEPFAGGVMVVTIADYEKTAQQHGEAAIRPILDDVLNFVTEAAGEGAFLCRTSEQELALVWPRDRVEQTQRIVHQITEKLWDYQLRTLGGVTVIFGWGFYETEGETLQRATESAREQMLESRRHRRTTITGVGRFRRQMVG